MAEDDAADRPRDEAERIGGEGEQGAGQRIVGREEQPVEDQSGGGAVEEEIVPFDGGADQARHHHPPQRRPRSCLIHASSSSLRGRSARCRRARPARRVRRLVTVIRAGQPSPPLTGGAAASVRPTLMLICRSSKKPPVGPTGLEWAKWSSRPVDPRDRVAALTASRIAPPALKSQPGPVRPAAVEVGPAPAAAAAPARCGSASCSALRRRQALDLVRA